MKLKTLFIIAFSSYFYLVSPISLAANTNSQILDKVLVVVNDNIITESQLQQQIVIARQELKLSQTPIPNPTALRKQVLNRLIDQELEFQVAKNMGVAVEDADVDRTINEIASRNHITVAKLRQELQKQGFNFNHYRRNIREQMLLGQVQQKALAGKIIIPEAEVNQLAAKLAKQPVKSHSNSAAEYNVQDILIGLSATPATEEVQQKKQLAESLLAKLRKGEDFQKLAAAESNGQQAFQGGDLGWRKLNDLPELFVQPLTTMKAGDFVGPLRASNGFHIIRLTGIRNQTHALEPQITTETQVRQIFIKNDPLASPTANKLRLESIRNDIVHGKDFAKLAEENSQDANSLNKGGLMDWIKPGATDPAFEAVMNSLKPGDTSQPFASQYGWHLMQVVARRKVNNKTGFYREQARQILVSRKSAEALQIWLQELRSQAYIKFNNAKE